MEIIGVVVIGVVIGLYFYSSYKGKQKDKDSKNVKNHKQENKTVQELFDFKSISERGIVQLNDGTFTATIEVSQINQRLNNLDENTSIWRKFRNLVNSLGIRHTMLIQSQYLDLADFVNKFEEESENIEGLTKEFKDAREEILLGYKEYSEYKMHDVKGYVIFRFNPYKDGLENGLDTGNSTINNLLNATKNKVSTKMPEDEAIELATSILEEVTDLAYQLFNGMGNKSVRLNRTGILNMVYMFLNRDLALVQRLHDAAKSNSFGEFKYSETPFIIENLAEYEEMKLQGYNVEYVPNNEHEEVNIVKNENEENRVLEPTH